MDMVRPRGVKVPGPHHIHIRPMPPMPSALLSPAQLALAASHQRSSASGHQSIRHASQQVEQRGVCKFDDGLAGILCRAGVERVGGHLLARAEVVQAQGSAHSVDLGGGH